MITKNNGGFFKHKLFSPVNYFTFFLSTAFVVSISFILFFKYIDIQLDEIKWSAPITFGNVLFLSLIFTVIDGIRRKLTIERPVKKIIEATNKITDGDFSVRLAPMFSENSNNEFDIIAGNLNKMAAELSGIETLRTDFIANVSHELKTPLAVIQNYATMLSEKNISEEQRVDYAKNINIATRRLTDLITNILKLNKLENQQIFPDAKSYNLSEQICECMLGFENIWEEKNIAIETDIDEDVVITADAELLSLVWNNLFSNAFKFTAKGGKVNISVKKNDNSVIVAISDTGCGISEETGKRIFEKFYQGDTSHSVKGNGLGLALVKKVINITDGNIVVESAVGKGSTFTVTVPLIPSGEQHKR